MGGSTSKQQSINVQSITDKSLSDATAQWNSTWYPQAQQYTRDYTDPKFQTAADNLAAARSALEGQISTSAASTLSGAKTYTDGQLASYSKTADIASTYATQSSLTSAQTDLNAAISSLQTTAEGNLTAAKTYADGQWTNVWSGEAKGYATSAQTAAQTYADNQLSTKLADYSKTTDIQGTYATRQALSNAESGLNTSISGLQSSLTTGLATNLSAAQTYADTALTNKFASNATFGQNLTVSGGLQAGDSRIVNWAFFQKDNKGCLGYFDGQTRKELLCLDTTGNLQDADGKYLFMLRSDTAQGL